MKLGFVTCVQLGFSCMEAIYEHGGELNLAITLPDHRATEKSGRVYIDNFCKENNIPLLKVNHINDSESVSAIKELDWLFIIGWSQIANEQVITAPKKGVLGIHPTLLPEGRGRAAIPWAILYGLEQTGATLFKLDEGVDTGPIALQHKIKLAEDITATDLYELVNQAHVDLIQACYPLLKENRLPLIQQDERKATCWAGRRPEDGIINMHGSVTDAERLVRALTRPYPGAFIIKDNAKLIIWKASLTQSIEDKMVLKFEDGDLYCKEIEIQHS